MDWIKLIAAIRLSHKQNPHFVTLCKVLNIIDRHSGYTYIISCTGEINIAGVIDLVEMHIKPTFGLPYRIVSEKNVLFMSAEFEDWLINTMIRHAVCTTHWTNTDG